METASSPQAPPARPPLPLNRIGGVLSSPWLPLLVLAAAMACSALAIMVVTRGQSFLGDEWGLFASYPGFSLHDMLQPRVGHLQIVVILLYKGMVELFGPSRVAFRILLAAEVLAAAALLFELVRRRVGDWLALGPVILVLGFGSAGEVYSTTLGVGVMIPIVTGLAMLLCLERGDRAGDVAASVLLVIGLATYGPALAFAAGAVVAVLFARGREGWRKSWVFAIPIGLYVIWRVWASPGDGAEVTFDNLLHLPNSMLDSAAAVLSAASGLFGTKAESVVPLEWGRVLVPLVAAGALVAVRWRRGTTINGWLWVYGAMPLAYWAAVGAVAESARPPEAARYQLLATIFLVLLFAQLFEGVRPSPRAIIGVLAVSFLALLPNLDALRDFGAFYRANSEENRAELTALEIARDQAVPGLVIEAGGITSGLLADMVIPASEYYAAADAHGTPAMTLEELKDSSESVRQAADRELILAEGIRPRPASAESRNGGTLEAGPVTSGELSSEGQCVRLTPVEGTTATTAFVLPVGGFSFEAPPGAPPALALRRFGDQFSPLGPPATEGPQAVRLPRDRAAAPWRLAVGATRPLKICPLLP